MDTLPNTPVASQAATEAARRRSFAIIAHPDAGKTTLTEQLLLKGGAIQLAGAVRAKGNRRRTRSDWMSIEQDRGISVATSVMTFERDNLIFNLLDTPGHEDFSEDTYRTLTAVDAAVMVLDAAKGIEAQTLKLFEVCRLRDIPIITFINKMDRDGARAAGAARRDREDPGAGRLARHLADRGRAATSLGVYDLLSPTVRLLDTADGSHIPVEGLADPALDKLIPAARLAELREQADLVQGGYPEFDEEAFLQGT
jgi:peptide chain release factor 3